MQRVLATEARWLAAHGAVPSPSHEAGRRLRCTYDVLDASAVPAALRAEALAVVASSPHGRAVLVGGGRAPRGATRDARELCMHGLVRCGFGRLRVRPAAAELGVALPAAGRWLDPVAVADALGPGDDGKEAGR